VQSFADAYDQLITALQQKRAVLLG
jgi:hypothetical protein